MNKQQANILLVNILDRLVHKYPDLRFSQILSVFEYVKETRPNKPNNLQSYWIDEFYLGSNAILYRVRQKIKDTCPELPEESISG